MNCRGTLVSILICAASPVLAQGFPVVSDHYTSGSQLELFKPQSLGVTGGGSPRELVPISLSMIQDFEAWRTNAYNDSAMYCTIGYGHLLAKKPCEQSSVELVAFVQPLAVSFGLDLLEKDTVRARLAIKGLVHVSLTDEQFGALTSFVFNVGVGNFSNSSLLELINNGNYNGAAAQFGRWILAKKVVQNGLITRRACERTLFNGDLSLAANGRFTRSNCGSLGAAPGVQDLIDIEAGE